MSSYLPNNYHGLVVRCTAMGWFLVFIEIHARPTFQNVQMSHHNLSFSSKDCELDSDPLVLNKPWCDVNFRSQIVYMIFTGLKPRLCNMFIIHIYIYIFFSTWEDEGVCSYHFGTCFVTTNIDFGKLFSLGIRHEVRSEWTSLAHWPISSPAPNTGSAQYMGILEFS